MEGLSFRVGPYCSGIHLCRDLTGTLRLTSAISTPISRHTAHDHDKNMTRRGVGSITLPETNIASENRHPQ